MQKNFQRNKKIQRQYFFNNTLPDQLGDNYQEERTYFWNKLKNDIQTLDVMNEILGQSFAIFVRKFRSLYGFNVEELEYLITAILDIIFSRFDVMSETRTIMLRLLNELVQYIKGYKLQNLKIDFKIFYEFLEKYYLTNESKSMSTEQGLYQQLTEIVYLVKRMRIYFTDDSIYEIYSIFKQKFNPLEGNIGYQILALFMKCNVEDKQKHKQFFQNLADEIIEFFLYKYTDKENVQLMVIKEIAKYHPDLDWQKHYEKIFYVILRHINNLLRIDQNQEEKQDRVLQTLLPDALSGIKCSLKLIPDLIVYLMPPSTSPNFEKFWGLTDRVFQLIDSLLTPSQADILDWAGDIFKFFKYTTRGFYRKYKKDEKMVKREQKYSKEDCCDFDSDDEDGNFDGDINNQIFVHQNFDCFTFKEVIPEKFQINSDDKMEEEKNKPVFNKNNRKIVDTTYCLDEKCQEIFSQRILGFLKKALFMEDQGYALAKLINLFANISPEKVLGEFMDYLFKIIREYENEMSFFTLKNILLFLIQPIIKNSTNKKLNVGMITLIQWVKESFKFFEIQGFLENYDMIEIYSKILLYSPLNNYEDLLESYYQQYPKKNETDFEEEYNLPERNYIQAIKDLQEWNNQFYQLILNNIGNLSIKELEQYEGSLIIDLQNILWQYFSQQSPKNRKNQLKQLFTRLDEQIFQDSVQVISFILTAFSMLEPELLLKHMLNLITDKMLKKRINLDEIETFKKQKIFHILDTHPNKENILKQELTVHNTESLIYYLTLLENVLTYSNEHIIQYQEQIDTIVLLCFFNDENTVFEKACDILHTILISVVNYYPKDLYYLTQKQLENPEKKFFYAKNPPRLDLDEYSIEWYVPSQKGKDYCVQILNNYFYKILTEIGVTYFKQPGFKIINYKENHEKLIDQLILHPAEDNQHKKEFYKNLFIILACFSAINVRVPYLIDENTPQLFKDFGKKYFFQEFEGIRQQMLDFAYKLPSLLFQKEIMYDGLILEIFYFINKEIYGETFVKTEVEKVTSQVQGVKVLNNFENKFQFDSRFYMIVENMAFLYEKIDFYFMMNPTQSPNQEQFFHLYFILSFAPNYSFKFFLRYHHDTMDVSNNIYHDLHLCLTDFLYKKIDPTNEKSYTYKLKNCTEAQKPELDKALLMIILQLRRIQKLINSQCCAHDPRSFQNMYKLMGFYEVFEQKIYKKAFINIIYKSLCQHYDDTYLVETLYKTEKRPEILLETTEFFKQNKPQHLHSISKEKAELMQASNQQLIEKISQDLINPDIHWKPKIIFGLFSCYLINPLQKCQESKQISVLMDSYFKMSVTDENQHLNQLGRSGILRIINKNKRTNTIIRQKNHIYLNNDIQYQYDNTETNMQIEQGEKKDIEEFLTWHFIKKEDMNHVLKQRFIGFYEDSQQLPQKENYEMDRSQWLGKTCFKYFKDPAFCEKFLKKMMLDKDIAIVEQELDLDLTGQQQTHNMDITNFEDNFFNSLQISFSFTFDRDRKKQYTLFTNNHTIQLYDVYMKFFKKIFQAIGDDFYKSTFKTIKEFSKDHDNMEKQRIVYFYIAAIIKWLSKIPEEQHQKYIDFCIPICNDILEYSCTELFKDFIASIYYMCKRNDVRISSKLMDPMLKKAQSLKIPGKRFRYYDLLKYFIITNGTHARQWGIEALKQIQNQKISDLKECEEIVDIITDILVYILCVPLNMKKLQKQNWLEGGIQKYIDNGQIYAYTDITGFEKNEEVVKLFTFLKQQLADQSNEEQHKLYCKIAFTLMDNLVVHRYNDMFWGFFKEIFVHLLELKCEDINETSVLQKLAESDYPSHIAKELKEIMEVKINSSNWQVKTKTITFLRDFLFYQFYLQNEVKIPNFIKTAYLDPNIDISWLAVTATSDILKTGRLVEYKQLFEEYNKDANIKLPKNTKAPKFQELKDKKQVGLFVLMSLIMTSQDDIYEFTSQALLTIIKNQTMSPIVKKVVTQFFSKYWTANKNNQEDKFYNTSQYVIEDEVIDLISNLSNNLSYYA